MANRIRLRDARPKAFWGALIGAATSVAGSLISANQQKKAAEEQKRQQQLADDRKLAANMTQVMALNQNAQRAYEDQFRTNFKLGGRPKCGLGWLGKGLLSSLPAIGQAAGSIVDGALANNNNTIAPIDTNTETNEEQKLAYGGKTRPTAGAVVQRGGVAQPIGYNTFLLRGMSHDDTNSKGQSGIYLNLNGRDVEAEGGEILHKNGNQFEIISDRIGYGGQSYADHVLSGENPDNIFNMQEQSKRRQLRNGGTTSPVREMAAFGWPDDLWGSILTRGNRFLGFDTDNPDYQAALAQAQSLVADIPSTYNGRVVSGVTRNPEDLIEYNPITNKYSVRNPYLNTGIAPAGGFRVNPAKIARGIQQTSRLANNVRNAMRGQVAANNVRNAAKATEQANRAAAAVEAERRAQAALRSIGATADNATTTARNAYAGARTGSGSAKDLIDLRRLYTGNPGLPPLGGVPEGSLNFRTGINIGINGRKVLPYVAGIGGAGALVGGTAYLANRGSNRTYPSTTPRTQLGYNVANPSVLDTTRVDSSFIAPIDSIVGDSTFVPIDSINVNGQQINTTLPNDTIVANLASPNVVNPANIETDPLTIAERQGGVAPSSSTVPSRTPVSNSSSTTSSRTSTNRPTQSSGVMTAEERNRILRQGFGPYTTNYDNYDFLRTQEDTDYPNRVRQDMQNRVAADMTGLVYNDSTGGLEAAPTATTVEQTLPSNRLGMSPTTGDFINAGIGILGSVLSNSIMQRSLKNMSKYAPSAPTPYQAGKLVTTFNINPQRAEIARQRQQNFKAIKENTASSAAAIEKQQLVNTATTDAENKLFGQKFNTEAEMLNRDTLNRQQVANMTVHAYNDWRNRLAEYNRGLGQARAASNVAMIQGIGDSVSGLIESGMNNYNRDLDRRALAAASEQGTVERLINFGYPLDQQTYASIAINSKNEDARRLAYSKLTRKNQRRLRNGGLYVS